MFRSFALTVTAVAAVLAGAALFAIAARGVGAGAIHLLRGHAGQAVIVGVLSAGCFLGALAFLLPGRLRRIIRAGEERRYRVPVTFAATVVLFTILIAAAVTDRASGERILGLVPPAALWPATLAFAALFTLAFILPGLAYRTGPNLPANTPEVPQPAPELAWSAKNFRSPLLRRTVLALVLG